MAFQQVDFLLAGMTGINGEPLNGGKVYTYTAGTDTLAYLYTENTGSVAHPNPVTLDANGRVLAFAQGAFKFIIKDSADAVQYTWDGLTFVNTVDTYVKKTGDTMTGALEAPAITVGGQAVIINSDARLSDSRKCNNTFDNAATSRTALGLGDSATKNVGTAAGTVAAGDHTHSLSGGTLTGFGDAAAKNTGITAGTVAAGDHAHTGVYAPLVHDHDNATTGADGFMSKEDKAKLDALGTGAFINVVSDFDGYATMNPSIFYTSVAGAKLFLGNASTGAIDSSSNVDSRGGNGYYYAELDYATVSTHAVGFYFQLLSQFVTMQGYTSSETDLVAGHYVFMYNIGNPSAFAAAIAANLGVGTVTIVGPTNANNQIIGFSI